MKNPMETYAKMEVNRSPYEVSSVVGLTPCHVFVRVQVTNLRQFDRFIAHDNVGRDRLPPRTWDPERGRRDATGTGTKHATFNRTTKSMKVFICKSLLIAIAQCTQEMIILKQGTYDLFIFVSSAEKKTDETFKENYHE